MSHHPRAEVAWTAGLFAVGSACFALAAIVSQWASVTRPGIGVTFFAGSVFFTAAAALQLRSERDVASAIQLAGTLFFNVSTFAGMKHGFDARQADLRVWTPDVLGSACFLISSAMAVSAAPRSRMAAVNLLGSVAFGISAIAALVEPSTDEPVSAAIANATTSIGALCFLMGSWLLVVESDAAPAGAASPG
jgi:hypothetical protein